MNLNANLIIDCHYLPCIEYFAFVERFDEIHLDGAGFYVKQSYRNRCKIRGANRVEQLIIPVKHTGKKIPVRKVEIDYGQKWLPGHLRTIQSAYGRAPFFEYYAEELLAIMNKKHRYLFDLNIELLTKCFHFLGIRKTIAVEDYYYKSVSAGYYDARDLIHPKKAKSGFVPVAYPQVFGKGFDDNLSIIDLIFCEGPNALGTIIKSKWGKSDKFD